MSEQQMHVEDAMDSKLAKTAVRIFVWIAPFVMGAFGWFITSQLSDIKQLQRDQGEKLQTVTSDVKVLNTNIHAGVIWRITELERRLNDVERATKTP